MLSRWQREYTCDWCGAIQRRLGGTLSVHSATGWHVVWRICDPCLDCLFNLRGEQTYDQVVTSQRDEVVQQARRRLHAVGR